MVTASLKMTFRQLFENSGGDPCKKTRFWALGLAIENQQMYEDQAVEHSRWEEVRPKSWLRNGLCSALWICVFVFVYFYV